MMFALTISAPTPVNKAQNTSEERQPSGTHAWTSSIVFLLDMADEKQLPLQCKVGHAGHTVGKKQHEIIWTQGLSRDMGLGERSVLSGLASSAVSVLF